VLDGLDHCWVGQLYIGLVCTVHVGLFIICDLQYVGYDYIKSNQLLMFITFSKIII